MKLGFDRSPRRATSIDLATGSLPNQALISLSSLANQLNLSLSPVDRHVGIVAQLITYPLHTVNTRQQTDRDSTKKSEVGGIERMCQVVTKEGWGRLYSGLAPSLIGTALSQIVPLPWCGKHMSNGEETGEPTPTPTESEEPKRVVGVALELLLRVVGLVVAVLPFLVIKSNGFCTNQYHLDTLLMLFSLIAVQGYLFISFVRDFHSLYPFLLCLLVGVVFISNYPGFGDGARHPFFVALLSLLVVFFCRLSLSLYALEMSPVRALPRPGRLH